MTNLQRIQEIVNGKDEHQRNKLLITLRNEFCLCFCSKRSRFRCAENCEEHFSRWIVKEYDESSSFWKRFSN